MKTTKVLILCAHRPGRSPSQRYRFEQFLPFLESHGFEFEFSYLLDEYDDRVFYAPGRVGAKVLLLAKHFFRRLKDAFRFKHFDIIFIQRETMFLGTAFFDKLAASSKAKLIFDFDDSIWLADTSPGNKKWEFIKNPGKVFRSFDLADLVIAGNWFLAEKASHFTKNILIIPTTVDTQIHKPLDLPRSDESIVIGWSGSISTIKHFNTLLPVLRKLKNNFGNKIRIRIIADKPYLDAELNNESVVWSAGQEVQELNKFDIGIMPLPDDEWSKGKCGLKGLSYMACGIATVMSPVGVNTEIIHSGQNGLLAGTSEEWMEALTKLIEDKTLRKKLGAAGRQTVVEKYSVLANCDKYLEAFGYTQTN